MKIQLKPNYSNNAKCFSCGERLAIQGTEVAETLYRITKIDNFNYNYNYISVEVYTSDCKLCDKKLTLLENFSFILCLLLAVSLFFFFAISNNWDVFMTWVVGLGLSIFTLVIMGLISSYIHSEFFKRIFKDKSKKDIISFLKSKGWQEDKPVNGQKSHDEMYVPFNEGEIEALFLSIRMDYNYNIEVI